MTDLIRSEIERAYWSLRVVRHNHRCEAWDMKFPNFLDFIETNGLQEFITAPFATGGCFRLNPDKPWHRDNMGFDAKLIKRRSRQTSRTMKGSRTKRILTIEEWVMQLKLDAMRVHSGSITA